MLSAAARSRLTVVLVGARNPQNIGAAARAMQDFGFSDLRVVNEFSPPFEAAQLEAKSAVRAEEVMRSARLYSSLADAIADCSLIAGTTAVGERGLEIPVTPVKEAVGAIRAALAGEANSGSEAPTEESEQARQHSALRVNRVALLFGSEKTGLTKEQLSFCSLLLTIPMFAPPGRHLSMNLGQSVAVCLYEVVRDGFEGSRDLPESAAVLATSGDRERLTAMLQAVMQDTGYADRFPANARQTVIRRLANDLGSTAAEAATWMGILRLILMSLKDIQEREIPQ